MSRTGSWFCIACQPHGRYALRWLERQLLLRTLLGPRCVRVHSCPAGNCFLCVNVTYAHVVQSIESQSSWEELRDDRSRHR